MNRTIKFRGKSVLNDEWIYGDLVHRIDSPKTISPVQINGIGVKEETVGQFTGLFDKNGKEIYEGDILNNGQRNYLVCWNSERGAWCLKNKYLTYTTPLGFLSIELFVVGNIYDNSDLIKKE